MTQYRDLDGKLRNGTKPYRDGACGGCGMPCYRAEYHPHIACVMFKAVRNSDSVRANLNAVFEFGFRQGLKSRKRGGEEK